MDWWKTFFDAEYYGPNLEAINAERTEAEVDFVIEALKLKKRSEILDLCCGTGRHAIELARRGMRVCGLDYNADYLETAARKAAAAGVKLELARGDMRRIPFENRFAAAINLFASFGYFERDADNFKVFSSVARSLKPGGRFLLETLNREWLVSNFQEMRCSEDENGLETELSFFDPKEDVCVTRWFWKRGRRKTEMESRVKMYCYTTVKRELEKRGLRVADSYGDYDGSAYGMESGRLIIVAEKK
ncbi:MAG: class I SAM-dependent methyltransferase [bacterium]